MIYFPHDGENQSRVPRHGPACSYRTRHTGTRHTQGKEAAFIQDDKDASAEWGGAQFYKLAHGCHTQFSFTQNLALTRVNSEKGWSLIEVWQEARQGADPSARTQAVPS